MGSKEFTDGDRVYVLCLTCETEQIGTIEHFTEGTCWRCDNCGYAQDLEATARPHDGMGY